MAKRTYTPPSRRKGAYKSLALNTNPANLVVHRGIGMPDNFITRLVWSETAILNGFGTTITQNYAVRMNGPYDPQLAVGGNQPAFYDRFEAMYGMGVVIGAKMTVKFGLQTVTSTTSGDGPYIVGIHSNANEGLPTTDAPTLVCAANTTHGLLQYGSSPTTVTATYSPAMNLGRSQDDDTVQFATNNTPTRQWIGYVFASPSGTATNGSVVAHIVVEYLVRFGSLKPNIDV